MSGNERAFPSFDRVGDIVCSPEEGLTKREYIAAIAMQGMLANSALVNNTTPDTYVAKWALSQADALIAELAK
jgi:hypothetical protein